jgi:hypothetical protein
MYGSEELEELLTHGASDDADDLLALAVTPVSNESLSELLLEHISSEPLAAPPERPSPRPLPFLPFMSDP